MGAFLAAGRNHGDALFLQYQRSLGPTQIFWCRRQVCDWLINDQALAKAIESPLPCATALNGWSPLSRGTVGAVAVPLNSWGKAQELQQGLEDSEASLVFADEAPGYIRELNVSLAAVSADGESTDHTTAMADIFERDTAAVAEVVAVDRHDPAILMFTSGTSGRPKGAMLSHFNCCQALMNVEFIGAGTYMTNMEEMNKQLASPIPPKTLLAVPLFHISGLLSQALINLRHGRALFMMYKWDIDEAIRIVKDEKITVLMGAPVMLLEL